MTATCVTTLRSPEDTVGWVLTRVKGVEGWTDAEGVLWVRAREDEAAELTIVLTKYPSLRPILLVRADQSGTVKRAERKARRVAKALRARGYDA